jgi:hypothetical protein
MANVAAFLGGMFTVLLLEAFAIAQWLEPLRELIERIASIFQAT